MPMNLAVALRIVLLASVWSLTACGSPDQEGIGPGGGEATSHAGSISIIDPPSPSGAVSTADAASEASPANADSVPLACSADIGIKAADRLAKACRNVSPATHPPCNVANSCAVMADEIARSCALFDGKGEAMAECQPEPKSMEAAAAVVRLYYSALNARDFSVAWAQWGEDGPRNQSLSKFTAGFADTKSTAVTIGKLEPGDAGAGSVYQTVPVTIEAVQTNGQRQRFTGTFTLRRVNDVDGATPSQRRWHIDSAKLAPAH